MRRLLALLLAPALLPAAAGCHARERVCGTDAYPAKAVGNPTGRTCVPKNEEPPPGYVRYPAGQQPVYLDDEWDRYWRTLTVDDHGNIVPTPS